MMKIEEKKMFQVIGVMSGTSLDGLDIAYCEFEMKNGKWRYKIIKAKTIAYDHNWYIRLSKLHQQPALLYPKTDMFFGKYIGRCIADFIHENNFKVDLIASHGHTIFHQPENGFTAQIGHGGAIQIEAGITVVNDFRTQDVLLGGQGAPLIPIGDELLFSEYDACLNLGGFSNISFNRNNQRMAFDISPCNIILNQLAQQLGKAFDKDGIEAKNGIVNGKLLKLLNNLEYYTGLPPKSLGREWVEKHIQPLLLASNLSIPDLLATVTKHIVDQIVLVCKNYNIQNILITGGGAFNSFLIEQLKKSIPASINLPEVILIEYKEAMIFGFLGLLKLLGKPNTLSSVTGASSGYSSGAIWGN